MAALWDKGPERKNATASAFHLLLPFAVLAAHLIALFLILPPQQFALVLGLMTAYILPPAGKETVIPVGIALGIPWWLMAAAIALIDIETGLFMAYNFDLAYRIPVFGPWLFLFNEKGRSFIESHRWIQDLYFFGIVILVMVPFFGSGGIRGSVLGRLLGMERRMVFSAIVVGAVAGCLLIAFFSEVFILSLCTNGVVPAGIDAIVCNRT